MEISLSTELNRFIQEQVEDGSYDSKSEVVRAALEWFRARQGLLAAAGGPLGNNWAALGELSGGDIEALAFIVMMEATKSAEEDLKEIMAHVKAINNAKQAQRQLMSKINRDISTNLGQQDCEPPLDFSKGMGSERAYHRVLVHHPDPASPGSLKRIPTNLWQGKIDCLWQLESIRDDLQGKLDGMSEMSEMTSLRLQMMMDRRSKFINTLSNIMKKLSDTQDSIIQNLK